MTENDERPTLEIDNVLGIIEKYNKTPNNQAENLVIAFIQLDKFFLYFPERIPKNIKKYLHPIFQNPPNDEVMGLCAKCIVNALKSDRENDINPSDFSFKDIIGYVKSSKYTINTIKNLLEIIFTMVNKDDAYSKHQIKDIANSDANDIDIFFKYYNEFEDPSKISCLKCIKNIVSINVYERFAIFLPNLLDIAITTRKNKSPTLYDMSVDIFAMMSQSYSKDGIIKINEPTEYCNKLCELTKNYIGLKYLHILIDSIRICVQSSNSTISTVLEQIKLTSFFNNIEDKRVLESAIKLSLALMPYPSVKLSYIEKQDFDLSFAKKFDKNFANLILQIQDIIPYIIKIYYTNISLSLLCAKALAIFANTEKLEFRLCNQVIYTMHFQLADYTYVPYILAIASQCLKIKENEEPILRSKLFDRISLSIEANKTDEKIYQNYQRVIKDLNLESRTQYKEIDLKSINLDQLTTMINKQQITPYDILALYNQTPKPNQNCFKAIKKMFNKVDHFVSAEEYAKTIVGLLLSMLADIPIPLLFADPYYGNYNQMLNDEITFENENGSNPKKFSLNTLLSECNPNRNHHFPDMNNLLQNDDNEQIAALFNLDELLSHNNAYLYEILNRELSESRTRQYKINDIIINDPDQFIITILPQVINKSIDELLNNKNLNEQLDLGKIIHESFQFKIESLDDKPQASKRNDIVGKLRLMKGYEIIQEILDILNYIYIRDRMHHINFIYKPFLDNILEQMKYLFLSTGFYSPCSQLMIKYPFLFRLEDRYFLLQLFVKEPIMANDLFFRNDPNHDRKKRLPHALVKFAINRENIFKQGITILERFAKYRAYLDISFHGEKGFGDGPTREFFHLMSLEFSEKRHRLWRRSYKTSYEKDDDEKTLLSKLYTQNENGLFPYPTANTKYMHALGLFIAKAIQMEQIIDIPLNPAFFDLAAGREITLSDVDPELAENLSYGCEGFLDLDFTSCIEGKPYDIVKNGSNIIVDKDNFDIYKRALTEFICGKCVKKKIDAFVNGFTEVLDPIILTMFSGSEMLRILDGDRELLTAQSLKKFIACENGYNLNSEEIVNLIDIISKFDRENQKCFVQFVTGSPFLPLGGLAALDPPITVARRTGNQDDADDDKQLPTASTCFNRLKLPPYTSKEAMEEKLLLAITECKASFDLS